MRVLVSDDEPLARARLRQMLVEQGLEVVGEAGNGRETLRQYRRLRPDVILLDIRMPGMDGLEAALHLAREETPPAVIFTTAYGDHALEAFEAQAMDYLLKPVHRERLQQALAKTSRLLGKQLEALRAQAGAPARTHISARCRGRLELVAVADVLYFKADHKYVMVRHRRGEVLIEESLRALEEEFGAHFLRIHRNALVAVAQLTVLERAPDGRWRVRLRDCPETLEVSRAHRAAVRARLAPREKLP